MNQKNSDNFVQLVLDKCQDSFFAGSLPRIYHYCDRSPSRLASLAGLGVNLEDPAEFRAHALICSFLAFSRMRQDGTAGLGEALRAVITPYKFARAWLDILLRHTRLENLCNSLAHIVYHHDKGLFSCLSHARLLDELLVFERSSMDIKRKWVMQFCRTGLADNLGE